MTDKKLTTADFAVPAGMLEAVIGALYAKYVHVTAIDRRVMAVTAAGAVLLYQAENPVVPSTVQCREFAINCPFSDGTNRSRWALVEWQRIAYLKPAPELPAAIIAAITKHFGTNPADWVKDLAIEAYELGKAGA